MAKRTPGTLGTSEILQPFVYRLLYFPQSTKHAWVAEQLGITEREAEGPTEPKRPKTPSVQGRSKPRASHGGTSLSGPAAQRRVRA